MAIDTKELPGVVGRLVETFLSDTVFLNIERAGPRVTLTFDPFPHLCFQFQVFMRLVDSCVFPLTV